MIDVPLALSCAAYITPMGVALGRVLWRYGDIRDDIDHVAATLRTGLGVAWLVLGLACSPAWPLAAVLCAVLILRPSRARCPDCRCALDAAPRTAPDRELAPSWSTNE